MKTIKILLCVLTMVFLVSCSSKDASKASEDFKLELLNTIDLDGLVDEHPLFEILDDRIVISLGQERAIKLIDYKGNLLKEISEVGTGPGEISGLDKFYNHNISKELEYRDYNQNRINFFDYDLNYLRSEQASLKWMYHLYEYPNSEFRLENEFENVDGKFYFPVYARLFFPDSTKTIANSLIDNMNYDFTSELKVAANNDQIIVAKSSQNRIEFDIFDIYGNNLKTVIHPYPRIEREAEELKQFKESMNNQIKYKNWKDYNSLDYVFLDNLNRVWVQNMNEDKNINIIVFSDTGKYIKEFDTEMRRCKFKIYNDKMFKLIWDEEENYKFEIYKIEG